MELPEPAAAVPSAGDEDVAEFVHGGRLIEAVKLYRGKHGVDLLAAKNAVDKLAGR